MTKLVEVLRSVAVGGRHLAAGSYSSEEDSEADTLIAMGAARPVVAVAPRRSDLQSLALQKTLVLAGDSLTGRGNYGVSASAFSVTGRRVSVAATSHALFPGAAFFLNGAGPEYDGLRQADTRIDAGNFTFLLPAPPLNAPSTTNTSIVVQTRYLDRNWMQYANQAMGNPLLQIRNVGGSGDTSSDLAARYHRDVISARADVVSLMIGTNDVLRDVSDATLRANIESMVFQALDAGAFVILHTIPPINAAYATYTAARGARLLRVNSWIRQFATRVRGVLLNDAHAVLVNPSSGDFKASYASDNLHISGLGAQKLGIATYNLLKNLFVRAPAVVVSVGDTFVADSANPQINGNPLMTQGAGGSATGAVTQTDPIPEGYTVTETGSATVTVTTPASADGVGEDLQFVFVATAASDEVNVTLSSAPTLASRVQGGDRIFAECHLVGSGLSNVSRLDWILEIGIDGYVITISGLNNSNTAAWADDFDLWPRTPEFELPAGNITSVQMRLKVTCSAAGGGTFRYGRAAIVKAVR